VSRSHKAVIMIFLPGGPSHQDIFDLKMDAPSEIRGEFQPIATNVPGIQITEHLPRLAQMMDQCTLIRSMSDCDGDHDAFQCLTGRHIRNQAPGGWPAFGSAISKLQGAVDPAVPHSLGWRRRWDMEWDAAVSRGSSASRMPLSSRTKRRGGRHDVEWGDAGTRIDVPCSKVRQIRRDGREWRHGRIGYF
jgi:hypothetical protein